MPERLVTNFWTKNSEKEMQFDHYLNLIIEVSSEN